MQDRSNSFPTKDLEKNFTKGMEEATAMLGEMLDTSPSFTISALSVDVAEINGDQSQDDQVYGGDIQENEICLGTAALIFAPGEASNLVASLLEVDSVEEIDDMEKNDVLSEVANVVLNCCIKSLADNIEKPILMGIPALLINSPYLKSREGVILSSHFSNNDRGLSGKVKILLPLTLFKHDVGIAV